MSSRIARLAARLDALSRSRAPAEEVPCVIRCGYGLAVPLPPAVIDALALREGDQIQIRIPDPHSLHVVVIRPEPGRARPD